MIDRAGAEAVVTGKARGLTPGQTLRVASYKRDRWIELRRTGEDTFCITQHGFVRTEHDINIKSLRKLLRNLFKREFPRSNWLHVTLT